MMSKRFCAECKKKRKVQKYWFQLIENINETVHHTCISVCVWNMTKRANFPPQHWIHFSFVYLFFNISLHLFAICYLQWIHCRCYLTTARSIIRESFDHWTNIIFIFLPVQQFNCDIYFVFFCFFYLIFFQYFVWHRGFCFLYLNNKKFVKLNFFICFYLFCPNEICYLCMYNKIKSITA